MAQLASTLNPKMSGRSYHVFLNISNVCKPTGPIAPDRSTALLQERVNAGM
jgi:hypothetical protein